jgi:NADH:ubiquinone reductase (H+-translocating)
MPAQILILGGGFGGLYAARALERRVNPGAAQITLVSDVNYMLYTPLLPGASGGTLEPRHVVVSLRDELKRTDVRVGRVVGADPQARTVTYLDASDHRHRLHYDELIVSLGSTSRTVPVPGLDEHAIGFKTIAEAIALRNRLIQSLERAESCHDAVERAALLTFVFVGAGYAGLEGIAELQDFAQDLVEHYPRCRDHGLRFILVEARERVMPEIEEGLANFAVKRLRKRGLEVLTGTTLDAVTETSVTLSTGEQVPTRTVCWTAGVRPVDVVADLGLPLVDGGRIEADEYLRVPGREHVWALGDAAAVPDPARPGQACPPTCQHALRQGRLAGANVAAALYGGEVKPFTYKTLGVFVDMGRYEAVATTLGLRWKGFPAWFLARTYHLMMMPGFKRRMRLMADWTVGLLFGRDSSELGQLGHPPRLGLPSAGGAQGGGEPAPVSGVGLDDGPRP